MPDYRRAFVPGGTFFFTVVTYDRRPLFAEALNRRLLRSAIEECRRALPLTIEAFVLLPEHLHAIWTLPDGDSGFSKRWGTIKKSFTQAFLSAGGTGLEVSESRTHNRRRGIWQRRFWEHTIRDQNDFSNHVDYIHYNPVKHGLVDCPHKWSFSSFARHVKLNNYDKDWLCCCNGGLAVAPKFDAVRVQAME